MNETVKRILSGIVLAVFFVFSFNYTGFFSLPLFLFVLIAGIIGIREFYSIVTISSKEKPFMAGGTVLTILVIILGFVRSIAERVKNGEQADDFLITAVKIVDFNFSFLLAGLIFSMIIFFTLQLKRNNLQGSIYSVSTTLLGIVYVPLPFIHVVMLQNLDHGIFYIWLVAWATVMSDTMAYFSGKTMGKNKVGFAVSPNKTYEGYIGGFIGQVILTVLFYFSVKQFFNIPEMNVFEVLLFGTVIYIASVLGDLSESMLKRNGGVKDSGSIIPGHGGVLDLVDALIFTLPGAYYYILFMNHFKSVF